MAAVSENEPLFVSLRTRAPTILSDQLGYQGNKGGTGAWGGVGSEGQRDEPGGKLVSRPRSRR